MERVLERFRRRLCTRLILAGNGVARIFVWGGGHPVHFSSSLREPTAFSGGGGVVAEIFSHSRLPDRIQWGGGSSRDFSRSQINHIPSVPGNFWSIFGPPANHPPFMDTHGNSGHFPRLLTHTNHVATSIHSGKKHLTKVWGAARRVKPVFHRACFEADSAPILYAPYTRRVRPCLARIRRGQHRRRIRFKTRSMENGLYPARIFSVAVYTPNSDPISDVHWLVRCKIGSAVRGCAKLVDIRTCIENDRLVTSLVYCAIYAQLLVLRALGGASYRTGIILVVVRMAAPPATTSSALAHLVHRQWFIMHPWTRVDRWGRGGGTSPDAIYTRLCRLRRLTTNVG